MGKNVAYLRDSNLRPFDPENERARSVQAGSAAMG